MPRVAGQFVFNADELDQPPRPLVNPEPFYPHRARQMGIEGAVTVRFLVDVDGTVSEVTVVEATPRGLFEDNVLRTVPQWKFNPGRVAGRPVAAWVIRTIRFEFDD